MIVNDDIIDYLNHNKVPYITLFTELTNLVKNKHSRIEDIIKPKSGSNFDQGFVIYYREQLTEEMLVLLHNFFRNTCCNIENIVLITTTTVGLSRYYKQYCDLHRTKGLNIIEIPWMFWVNLFVLNETYQLTTLPKKEKIKSLFSYYGGTYEINPPERTIMTLFASQYNDVAYIDTMFSPASWSDVDNYLEYLTYFCDVASINEYKELYKRMIVKSKFQISKPYDISTLQLIEEKFTRKGPQWEVDSQSFFSLIRESNSTQNFYCMSEKTMRCFFNGVALLPTHGDYIIDDLESMGFIINKSLIDYSYLKEDNLFFRLKKLKKQLDEFKQVSYDDWYSLWLENYDEFQYNCEYLINSYKTNIIMPRLDNYFI